MARRFGGHAALAPLLPYARQLARARKFERDLEHFLGDGDGSPRVVKSLAHHPVYFLGDSPM